MLSKSNLHFWFTLIMLVYCGVTIQAQSETEKEVLDQWAMQYDTLRAIGWGSNSNYCDWPGITCDESNHIVKLDVQHLDLPGPVPSSIGDLEHVEYLDLHANKWTTLPESIKNLKKLKTLDIHLIEDLDHIPPIVFEISQLENLFARDCNIKKIPTEITKLKQLKNLSLTGNQISELPEELKELTSLEFLYLDNNLLTVLNDIFITDGPLQYLDVSFNQISNIDQRIGESTNLTTLLLDENLLVTLPSSITNLTKLETLSIRLNSLNQLPSDIEKMQGLVNLYVQHNKLTDLPAGLSELPVIKNLTFSHNGLTSLPPNLRDAPDLLSLYIHDNNLDFDDIIPYCKKFGVYIYYPQDSIYEYEKVQATIGESKTLTSYSPSPNENNTYQWYKDGEAINNAIQPTMIVNITESEDEFGTYHCEIENDEAWSLTLYRSIVQISPKDTISSVFDPQSIDLQLYPNPVQDLLYIKLSNDMLMNGYVRIVDFNGKTLINHRLLDRYSNINLSSLPSGFYNVNFYLPSSRTYYSYRIIKLSSK